VVPLGECCRVSAPAVEGEVLLTEVAFRGRRQMLCRISDGSGFLNAWVLLFHRPTAERFGARGSHRCFGEARRGPQGLEIVHPEYRRVDFIRRESRRRSSHADLSRHRRRYAGPAAAIGRPGIGSDGRARPQGLAARRSARGLAAAVAARCLAVRASAAGGRARGAAPRMAAPGAAAAGVRGACWRISCRSNSCAKRFQSDPGWPLVTDGALKAGLLSALPFQLTAAQTRVLREIEKDLGHAKPNCCAW